MICRPCAEAAEAEARYQSTTGKPSGGFYAIGKPRTIFTHPIDCGCTCQHRVIGTLKKPAAKG